MPIDPVAQCDDVYSAREKHKLAVAGLRRLTLVVVLGAALLLAIDFILFRQWRPPDAPDGRLARLGLFGLIVLGGVLHGWVRSARADFAHPARVGTALLLVSAGVGAYAAAASGGPSGYFAFGLMPLVFTWPLLMPGGARDSTVPAAGALVVHLTMLQLTSGSSLGREGRVILVLLVLAVVATVACGQVIELWRRRAAIASSTDWLTGALSREFLSERLKTLCAYRQRCLAPVSLVMMDIDRFKNINDAHGRDAGDEVLELLAKGIMTEIRGNDFVGRYGGDEFLLVLDECEGAHAVALVERLRRRLAENPMVIGEAQVRVTFSVGIVSLHEGDPLSAPELFAAAEKALETSKETGLNRTSVAGTSLVEDPITQP